jgi:hypothetical protein
MAENTIEQPINPNSETTIGKKGIWKKISEEPLRDVIVAILKHPPRNDADCKEQQTSVRFALNGQTAKEIAGKVAKIFMVSFITAMIVSIAPYLPGIMAEFMAILIKYQLIK